MANKYSVVELKRGAYIVNDKNEPTTIILSKRVAHKMCKEINRPKELRDWKY